jgi:hypothetical protein
VLAAIAVVGLVGLVGAGLLLTTGKARSPVLLPTPGASAAPATPHRPARRVSVEPPSPLVIGSVVKVTGGGLDPSQAAGAGVLQGGVVHPLTAGMDVAADGSFSVSGVVPNDLQPGPGTVVACNFDSAGRSDLARCAQLAVTVKR